MAAHRLELGGAAGEFGGVDGGEVGDGEAVGDGALGEAGLLGVVEHRARLHAQGSLVTMGVVEGEARAGQGRDQSLHRLREADFGVGHRLCLS